MNRRIHIFIAEPSDIIRSGIVSVLKRLSGLNIDIGEVIDISTLPIKLNEYKPDILIIDPSHLGIFSLQNLKSKIKGSDLKVIALQSTVTDVQTLKNYDEIISIYDSSDQIKDKLIEITKEDNQIPLKQELSVREKEIIVLIVKGLTNKQIAENLCLSAHTIMTHRRNISNKLQIHSSSGLIIYAIVKKLVELNEIKHSIYSRNDEG